MLLLTSQQINHITQFHLPPTHSFTSGMLNKSVFVHWQGVTLPRFACCWSNQSISPARYVHSSKLVLVEAALMRWAHIGTDSRTEWQTPYRFIDLLRMPHANNEIYGHKPTHPPEWWAGYHGERTVLYKEQEMRRRTYRSDQQSCTPAIEHKAHGNEKTNVQIGSAILYSGYSTQSTQEWEEERQIDQQSCTPAIVHKAHRNEKTNVQIGSEILYSGYCTQSIQEWEDKRTDRISDLVLWLLYTKHTGMRRQMYRSDQRSCTAAIEHKAHRTTTTTTI